MLEEEVKKSVNECAICWVATVDGQGRPNVSPEEFFISEGDNELLIANVSSAKQVRDILKNDSVCVSFAHVFKQKGFQLYGKARYIPTTSEEFDPLYAKFLPLTEGKMPVFGVIKIQVTEVNPIMSCRYTLSSSLSEDEHVKYMKNSFGVT